MVLIAQGQDKEGRFHLSKALNHAHGVLSSHQLVSQVQARHYIFTWAMLVPCIAAIVMHGCNAHKSWVLPRDL